MPIMPGIINTGQDEMAQLQIQAFNCFVLAADVSMGAIKVQCIRLL